MATRLAAFGGAVSRLAPLPGATTRLAVVDSLTRFHVAAAQSKNLPVDILLFGDSVTEWAQSNSLANMWTSQVREALRTAYPSGVIGGYGRIAALNSAGSPVPPAIASVVGTNVQTYGISRRGLQMTSSGHGLDYTFTGTGCDLIWPRLTGTSAFSYAIDGGGATVVNTSGATVESGHSTRISGLTAGAHTVAVRWSAGTAVTEGVMSYDGDEAKGVRTWNAGRSGEQLSERVVPTTWLRSIAMVDPDLVVISYGITDYRDNTQTPAGFKTNLETFIAQVRTQCVTLPSFLLIAPYEPDHGGIPAWPWSSYRQAIADVAAADADCTFLDMGPIFGPRAGRGTTLIFGDQIHLQPAGATAWANAVVDLLI